MDEPPLPTEPPPREPGDKPLPLLSARQWAVLVSRQLAECRRRRKTLAVMVVSVEHLRFLDEHGGFGALLDDGQAEHLHAHLGQRLLSRVRGSDRVVRLGSGRFGVVLVGIDATLAAQVTARVVPPLMDPYRLDDRMVVAQVRSGLAAHPEDGATGDALIRALADIGNAPAASH